MKLLRLEVTGYKNLINCDLQLDDFNIIIGPNNSGKSNLLEVFSFLDFVLNGSDDARRLIFEANFVPGRNYFTPNKFNNSIMLSINLEFTDEIEDSIYKYWYKIDIQPKVYSKTSKPSSGFISAEYLKFKNTKSTGIPKTIFERSNNEITKFISGQRQLKIDSYESALSIINKLKDMRDELDSPALKGFENIFTICKTPVIYSSPNEIKNNIGNYTSDKGAIIKDGRIAALNILEEISKILQSEKKDYFIEVLKDIIGIKNIEILTLGENNTIDSNIKLALVTFPNETINQLHQLSDGTLITLNLITYLFTNRYPIICIEELENSIHPKLLKKIIQLIKNNFSDIQIIITTHSPVLLNMVQVDEVNIMSSKESGHSEIYKAKDKKDLIKRLSSPFSSFSDIFFIEEE